MNKRFSVFITNDALVINNNKHNSKKYVNTINKCNLKLRRGFIFLEWDHSF